MSDLRKAAEMALEALEWNYGTDLCDIENCMAWLDKMNATIPALRQALAMEKFSEVNQEIEEALKQEPVAWMCSDELVRKGYIRISNSKDETWSIPLYTAPPRREWVGVTYDEVYEFVCTTDSYINLAKAIEAKLKEKNG